MQNMQRMAGNMMGNGGMGGMGGMGMPQANGTNHGFQRSNTMPSRSSSANLTAQQKKDLEGAEKLKSEANTLFKDQKYSEACSKYNAAIRVIRLNRELAKTQPGKDAEIACRNNIAMAKLEMKEYDQVLDQCERVLE